MIGHNSIAGYQLRSVIERSISGDQLRSVIERIERLEEEKKGIADDIRDVYKEAKGNDYDVKALRTIIRMRKQDADERAEHEQIVESYLNVLAMLVGTPLGDAAIERMSAAHA